MKTVTDSLIQIKQSSAFVSTGFAILAIATYILFVPSIHFIPGLGLYDEKRLLECILLIILAILAIVHTKTRTMLAHQILVIPRSHLMLLTAVVVIGTFSALLAQEPQRALLDVSVYILLFYGTLLIATQYQIAKEKYSYIFLNVIQLSSLFCLISFLSALAASKLEPVALLHWELFTNYSHIRFFSQFQSWTLALITLPIQFYLTATSENTQTKNYKFFLALAIACGWWFLLFSSGTRGTLLGIIVAVIVVMIAFGRSALPWLKWQAITAIIGLSLFFLFFMAPTLFGAFDTSAIQKGTIGRAITHSQGRFHLWEVALSMIQSNPVLGVGPMHYACGNTNNIAAHPHSAVMQIAAEWGLPATLIVIFLWLSGVSAWIRQGRKKLIGSNTGQTYLIVYPALLGSLVTASTHALFSGIIVMPLSQITMLAIIGWMMGIYYHSNAPTQSRSTTSIRQQIALISFPALALLFLFQGIAPDLVDFGELLNFKQFHLGTTHLMPRFWQQGLICD